MKGKSNEKYSIPILGFKNNDDEYDDDEKPEWVPTGDKIKTKWGKNVNSKKVGQEYPKPQLERKDRLNLNGLWSYSIRYRE